MKTKLQEGGRIVIPAVYRKALGLKPGDEVLLVVEDGEIRVVSPRQAIARAQSLVRRYGAQERNLPEELIRERRDEATGA
jgi:AbrB family looped-hinge helix DNA binding protein